MTQKLISRYSKSTAEDEQEINYFFTQDYIKNGTKIYDDSQHAGEIVNHG